MFRKLKSINLLYKLKIILKPSKGKVVSIFLFLFAFFTTPIILLNLTVREEYQTRIFSSEDEKLIPARVGIVFGAGLSRNGENPSMILKDRLDITYELYDTGKIQKIIISGDNRFKDYDEPTVMYNYLLEKGVSEFDLQRDFAGRSTYETCYRAKDIFGISEAILVTQNFHLPRALYTCQNLGIDVQGVTADRHLYPNMLFNKFRESIAIVDTYIKLFISPPDVVLGEKIVI